MGTNDILQKLRERDVREGRGYFNEVGEYVSNEKEKKGSDWDRESIYMPKGGTASKAQARIDRKKSPKYKMAQKAIADAAKAGREARDVGDIRAHARRGTGRGMPDEMERRQKAMRSEYFPQTGTRSDEEKGFFSGMYDKTIGEYQRGRDEKERLKEETKAAMAAEPDPFVKKEIARKGHQRYMQIAATEGQSERDRETAGGVALTAQRERDKEKYGRMAQHAGYRDRRIMDEEAGREGDTALEREATRLRKQRRIEAEEGPQVASGEGDEIQRTGFLQKNLRDLPLVGGMFGENEKDMTGDGQVAEEATSKFGARSGKAPWEEQQAQREKELATEEADDKALLKSMETEGEEAYGGEFLKDTSEAGKEAATVEFAASMNQDEAREAIAGLDEEEANAVGEEIKRLKGPQSEEYIDAKESMRDKDGNQRYVRYEGSGLVINMAMLEKDIKRNENMAMLKDIPIGNRAAMMAAWGYIDDKDLSIAQKKSAKEIKELEILNLQANKLKMEAEKASKALPPEKKLKYEQAMTGFRQATKDKDWDSATLFASQMREIGMPLAEFDPVALQAASDAKLLGKHPPMISIAKKYGIMSASGKPSVLPFYKQQGALSLKLSFLGKDASSSGGTLDLNEKIHTGSKITFGEILNTNGIETWDKVKGRIDEGGNDPTSKALAKSMGLETLKGVSREAYLHYAKSKVHDVISRSVWGPAYDEIKQAGLQTREAFRKEGEDTFRYPPLGEGATKKTKGGKEFLSFAGEHDVGRESVDPGLGKMAKERVVTDKAEKVAKTASQKVAQAKKVKASKAKAHEDEITKDNRVKVSGRQSKQKTNAEKKVEYMEEGTKRLNELVEGRIIKGRKKPLQGHPEFSSTEEAIKYYKNNPDKLKDMSLAFRHFISQK